MVFIQVLCFFLLKISHVTTLKITLFYINLGFNIFWSFNVDAIGLIFVLLTAFLIPLCLLYIYNSILFNYKLFVILLIILEFLLVNAFFTSNLLFFYVFFESVLIPMGLIIGIWGSRSRKINAFFLFFIYTLIGSLLILVALILIYSNCQSLDFFYIKTQQFSFIRQHFIWLSFFIGFAVKIPMVPFHVWLPEAHTEAPTVGSVLLAAVLLKLGSYGMLKFLFPLFYDITLFYTPLLLLLSFLGMFYVSLTAIRQVDIKKIIAYSSVAHMSYVVVGVLLCTSSACVGSVFLMLGHGLVSAGLFFCIGFLYERFKTRNIKYFGGVVSLAPLLTFAFLILTLANTAFPGTSNFVGEFLILLSLVFNKSMFEFALLSVSMILFGSIYAFWLFNRIFFGELNGSNFFVDLNKKEFYIIYTIIIFVIILGIFPYVCLNDFYYAVNFYLW